MLASLYYFYNMKLTVLACAFACLALSANGQRTFSTVSIQVNFPQAEYKATNPVTGVGGRWNVMQRLGKESPISIGGELNFLVSGSDSRQMDVYYLGFYDRYQLTANNNVFGIAFKTRADLVPGRNPVQPFIDGTIGTNIFFSSVDVSRQTFLGGTENVNGKTTKGYWAFVFGPGAGVDIVLGKRREIALTLKGSYLFGTNTKYLTDPYIDNEGKVFFTRKESRTDMIIAEAGVRFGLSRP
jgi:hypothetical protein